jgi:hypothetical protein
METLAPFALVTPEPGSHNPRLTRFTGRVPLNPTERFPSYDLFATQPIIGAVQPGALAGKACNKDESYETLDTAKRVCMQSSCCGGITQLRQGQYALRAGRTPVTNPKARSWIKEQAHHRTTDAGATEQLRTLQTTTLLSQAYFSEANQEILQNAIRREVYDATEQIVDKQDYLQLQIVMRSIFLQYAKHDTSSPEVIRQQIAELNAKVIDYCKRIVISNVKQYMHYRKDVATLPEPMAYGLATSSQGSRSLELKPFV